MIDCGVILGTADATNKMKRVVNSLFAATGGEIDVLLATHEHWDHLSAFIQAQPEFERIKVKSLWLAWTEDPNDALANELRGQRRATRRALQAALPRFRSAVRPPGDGDNDLAGRIESLLGFFGMGAAGGSDTGAALDWISEHARNKKYRRPGEGPIALPGTDGVHVFVLGPPHDKKQIKHSDASAAEIKGNVVYHLSQQQGAAAAFLAAALDGLPTDKTSAVDGLADCLMPFDSKHWLSPDAVGRAKSDKPTRTAVAANAAWQFAPKAATGNASRLFKSYFADAPWRRIDSDWLEVGSELALKLDNDTNNTSLAVAFELKNGDVLLFPADAQVGNWTSWEPLRWTYRDDSGTHDVTAADLLARTVFYKVGHHASHNATLRVGGLESMIGDLVAMIPVDHAMAVKKRWNMPYPKLLKALNERTRGRVMRIDKGLPKERPPGLSMRDWSAFRKATENSNDDFIEYVYRRVDE